MLRQVQELILDVENRPECAAVCSWNRSSELLCEVQRWLER
jgi:hypothetical protein